MTCQEQLGILSNVDPWSIIPTPLNRDCNKDPNIKAFKRRFIHHSATLITSVLHGLYVKAWPRKLLSHVSASLPSSRPANHAKLDATMYFSMSRVVGEP